MSLYEPLTDEQRERFLRTPELLIGTWWGRTPIYRISWALKKKVVLSGPTTFKLTVLELLHTYEYLCTDATMRLFHTGAEFVMDEGTVEVNYTPTVWYPYVGFLVLNGIENLNRSARHMALTSFLQEASAMPPGSRYTRTASVLYDPEIPLERRQQAYRILYPDEFPEQSVEPPQPKVSEPPLPTKSSWERLDEDAAF